MRIHHVSFHVSVIVAAVCLSLAGSAFAQEEVNWAAVQWPFSTTTSVGVATEDIFGRVYEPGVTDSPGMGIGILAQLGYGPDGSDPETSPWWTWLPAVYNGDLDNDDEYVSFITPGSAGTFDYAYRFSMDVGASWVYADMRDINHPTPPGGTEDGYNAADAGNLIVLGEDDICSKWIQPPDCEYGIDMPSYAFKPEQGDLIRRYVVGDDWLCDGRPITDIRWWGSYPGWPEEAPPGSTGIGRPIGFRLSWYTDIPAELTVEGYSRPGHLLTNVIVDLLGYNVPAQAAGEVSEFYYCTVDKPYAPPVFLEHEYLYEVELEAPWNEKRGRIYWLTIEAIYPVGYEPDEMHPEWGWKTSTEKDVIDDAVVWVVQDPMVPDWKEMIWPDYPWQGPTISGLFWPPVMVPTYYMAFTQEAIEGPSVNMAFELLTDVCPRRTEKWEQPPDMFMGTDMWSWTDLEDAHKSDWLRADDFVSDGRLISDIHWWGSYSNWMMAVDGSETNPVAPPGTNLFMRPLGFNLSWHESKDPECIPGVELTNVFVEMMYCHEMFYGTVTQSWNQEPFIYEHEYQYYVDLLDVADPWPEEEGGHYWLNIEAIFDPRFTPSQDPGFSHAGWGWKISEIEPDGMEDCSAAVSNRLGGPWISDPTVGGIQPPHPKADRPYNLAFELTTHEVSTNSPTLPIVITNAVSKVGNTVHIVKTVGTSGTGTQYLQMNTNLLTNVWTDIPGQTKAAPFPPPITNTWTVTGVTDSNVFYRVLEQ